jgi:hypothetical protein
LVASSDVEGQMFRREFTPSALRRSLGFTLGSVRPDVVLGPLTAAAAHHDGALNLSEKGPALRNSQTRKADTWVPSSLNANCWVSRTIDAAAVPHRCTRLGARTAASSNFGSTTNGIIVPAGLGTLRPLGGANVTVGYYATVGYRARDAACILLRFKFGVCGVRKAVSAASGCSLHDSAPKAQVAR